LGSKCWEGSAGKAVVLGRQWCWEGSAGTGRARCWEGRVMPDGRIEDEIVIAAAPEAAWTTLTGDG